jgi:hypothetical protein
MAGLALPTAWSQRCEYHGPLPCSNRVVRRLFSEPGAPIYTEEITTIPLLRPGYHENLGEVLLLDLLLYRPMQSDRRPADPESQLGILVFITSTSPSLQA